MATSLDSNIPRGLFIVVEGLDKAGKSTQCERLVTSLKQHDIPVQSRRFPGQVINRYLQGEIQMDDHAIHLLFSANRWEAAASIKKELSSGTTVIVDRYYYSGCVYSAAKNIPGLDLKWARWPEVGLPCPDICIFLDIPTDEAQKRGGYGGERYETSEMQTEVRRLFEEMRKMELDRFRVVDASQSPHEVAKEVLDVVLQEVERSQKGELDENVQTVQPLES
ncbi:MAG: Slx4p interacting protein [Watsoniomyces obsoletus]|nr:MAG: Slx4p interacting protein [Watsoniomyces obsoletus]